MEAKCDELFGDRRQELVVIGRDMGRAALIAGFDACLLTDEEVGDGCHAWDEFDDPILPWVVSR